MKKLTRATAGLGLAVLATTALSGLAIAQSAINATAEKPLGAQSVEPVHELTLAQQLAIYGVENQDAMSLIVAAQIMDQYLLSDSDLQPRDSRGEIPEGVTPVISSVSDILAAARDLAGDRQDLIGLIEDVEAGGSRGSIYGEGSYEDYIGPYDSIAYDEGFFGNERAIVTLNGWDDTDLDLYVYDEYGNLICEGASYTSSEYCEWTPRWTGNFTIVVYNNGGIENSYSLWTN
ncbi:MAG: hypothetical protein ACFCVH_11825 [Alphaproteobacteria bacterium]